MNEDISLGRIRKCRINLEYSNPFFAYLLLHLKPQKFSKEIEESLKSSGQKLTMAVDVNSNLYYSDDFVKELDDDMLTNVLVHELGHLFLSHHFRLERQFKECSQIANISADIKVNEILIKNGFEINKLEGCCYPANDKFSYGKIKIKDISKLTSEEVYDKFLKQAEDNKMVKKIKYQFDNHLFDGKKNKGEEGEETEEGKEKGISQKEFEREQKKRMIEAYENAKMRGKTPKGMERFVDSLLESKINWRTLLQREIKNEIISDYSFRKRSKKSISCGYYLPSVVKENLEIKVVIDLSGSISNDDLKDFLSEMIGISKTFKNQISMEVITHEVEVNDVMKLNRATEDKILGLKLNGGGGTSHKGVWKYLNENRGRNLAVILTDGYSDIEYDDKPKCNILFVVSKGGAEDNNFPFGKIIRLD